MENWSAAMIALSSLAHEVLDAELRPMEVEDELTFMDLQEMARSILNEHGAAIREAAIIERDKIARADD